MSDLVHETLNASVVSNITRRAFLTRAAWLGLSMPILGGLLAACGGDDDDDGGTDTGGGQSTATAATSAQPSAAGSSSTSTTSEATTAAESTFEDVVVAQSADIRYFDPTARMTSTDASIALNIYDTLTHLDEDFEVVPGLATEWELTGDDNQTWQLGLREGVTFHNGEPFNADTIVAWYERLLVVPDILPGRSSSLQQISTVDNVEKIDDYTVTFHSSAPNPTLLRNLTTYFLMVPPKGIFEEEGPEALMEKGIGTGPYKFAEWEKGEYVSLEANDEYWAGPPAIRSLQFRIIPEPSSRAAALLNNEVQIADAIPIASIAQIEGSSNAVLKSIPLAAWIFWVQMNVRDIEILQDVRVRQAMNHAVDKQAIIDSIFAGNAINSANIVTRESFGYTEVPVYEYDPEKAKQLLTEAGHPDGFSIKFYYSPGHYVGDTEAVQAIANYLNDVGIEIEFVQNEWANHLDLNSSEQIDGLYYTGKTNLAIDADYMFSELQPGKIYGWMYPIQGEAAELYEQEHQEMDEVKRAELCGQISQLYRDDAGIIFLWQPIGLFGVAEGLNWTPSGDGYIRGYLMA